MRLALLMVAVNALVFWALWVRVSTAFPARRRRARILLAVLFWLPLLPTMLMPFKADALRVFRSDAPLWLSVPSMAIQFAVLCYGAWLIAFSFPAFAALKLRARLRPESVDLSRREWLKRAALVPPAAIIAGSGIGAIGAMRDPVIRTVTLPVPRELTNLHGLRIAQFSDVHIGRFVKTERLREIVQMVNAQDPDIVVCTGDLLDHAMEQLEDAQMMLRGVKHRHGVFMCLGNHEYYAAGPQLEQLIAGIEQTGCVMLRDASQRIRVGGDHLWMLGVDYPGRRQPKASFDEALKDVADDGAPRIVLAHNPSSFHEGRERPIDLQLSGHTHGGQVSMGRIGQYELSPVLPVELYHAGEYEHNGRKLYVNSGTGQWMPVRINCPPEITLIELV
ncbi:MAG: 3',5'-cyclic adenosine monophosphate phosphodiesterase CpdA [Planctomycetes bacterium]|nr:3',5'-cyclic adenosine monophosphate phosphodiesterase CpdA [Planctomycetota bacterium]